ncbi:MAG TPA: DUF5819 family protein [Enteractinococcus sp.]
MVSTVLVLLPPSTPLREPVNSTVSPYFSQNWRVFAPNILKINRTVEIRAQWRDDNNQLVHSDWVSLTEIEEQGVTGHFAPSRIHKNAFNSSQTLLSRYNDLNADQKERVRDTFIEATDEGDFQPINVDDLIEDLGREDSDVIRYLRMDYMYMRFATLYATAGFDEDIERVQWRITRERPNDFKNRFSDEKQYTDSTTTFGWRQSNVTMPEDILDEYRNLIERTGKEHLFRKAAENAQ